MGKQLLRIEPDINFFLLGIHCHLKDFKFAWLLNHTLNKKFKKIDPFILEKTKSEFSRYQDQNESENDYLFSNKSPNGYLVSKKKNVDYWLFLQDETDEGITKQYQKLINMSKHVLLAFEEKDQTIKEQFLF